MWNRFSGKSDYSKDDLPSQSSRRNDDEQQHPARRSGSITCSNDPRGFNPTSESYSSTTQGQHPEAASASIPSSYATASGNNTRELYVAPGLIRNASLADQMPRSSPLRSSRDQDETCGFRDKKRDRIERSDGCDQNIERRQKRDKRDKKKDSLRRSENGLDEEVGISRGPDDIPDQIASSGFSHCPGQHDAGIPGLNGVTPEQSAMSSHVQDQFPGQFPTQSSAPYRPPLTASEGGPGLAAEYYGDDGQSVAEQPGNRADTPSLIIGAEPHLQPALAVAAPPPEPSASGAVGAAASFFGGEFEEDEASSTHGQQNLPTYVTGQFSPNSNYHSSSAPVIPTIGGTAIGSAAGFFIDSQTSSHQQRPDHESSIGGAPSEYSTMTTHRPPSRTQDSHYTSISRPPKLGKQPSQSSNIPMYAAGVAGATGLAAAAYEHNHHSSNQDLSSMPQYSTTSMSQRHRNHGPFSALMDFFKDPEGVAQFEEYSQIIGVCRQCFAPGSTPRDAPRKHFYRRRSHERYGSSARVDKDSRYHSSENEGRRNNKSWLATGLEIYGLAKVGKSLFLEKSDFDDTYGVKTGRFSPEGRDRKARRRSRSKERVEIGITGDGTSDRKESRGDDSAGTKRMTYSARRHSRTRSRSKDRKTDLTDAAIGAALETSVVVPSSRRRSRSPKGTSVQGKHKIQESSPERRHKTKKKKKRDRGFFGFGNGSSSSSSVDLAYTRSQGKHRSSNRSHGKSKDDKKAEAALLGLGAAAAALALNDGRQDHRRKGVRELVGVKETKDHDGHNSGQARRSKKSSENPEDELWESAAEDDYESTSSNLAYGAPVRRDSQASLSSESSGTNKWGWRWGSKKIRRASSPRRKSSDHSSFPVIAAVAGAGLTGAAMTSQDQRQGSAMDSTRSLTLQHVYPVPTSDPSRFDVGREASIVPSSRPVTSTRPEAVPLQHPRPIAPVSAAAIHSSQTAYDHSYSAPTGLAVFSQIPYHHHLETSDARHDTHEASIPGSFPRFEQQADDTARNFRLRRRDTSPARFGEDFISSSMAPRHRASAKDGSSAVRFDLTEEQEDRDRHERRRKRKQDKERREGKEQEQTEKDRRASKEQLRKKSGSKTTTEEVPEGSSEKAWAGPAAAAVIGAAIGAAAATDRSRSEETREERRERRRKERELENEEEALSKKERRRRQQERHDQEAAIKESGGLPHEIFASHEYADHQERSPEKQDMSVWQEAASTKGSSSHENYGAFFTPPEFLNRSSDQVKITSANADADIDLEQVPQVVTVEPKRGHGLSDSPAFSLADTDDKIDPSRMSFPWQVPKLRLVEPTPPSTRGSTPIPRSKDAGNEGFEEPRKEPSSSKVKWGDDQTHEYTIIAPKEDHDEFIEPLSREISDTDAVDLSRSTPKRDLPFNETHPHSDSTLECSSAPYGEDAEFAATLAASAEDAGFDPSIVISNPTYRRRDSPRGSNERSMPGGFDDENEPRLNKREQNRTEKASRRQSPNDDPNMRDDDAIVHDIISQVEESEYQPSNQALSENFNGEWEGKKKTKSKKSKKARQGFEPRDDSLEESEVASKALASESRDVYESPAEDVRSIVSSALISNEADSDRKIRKKSKQDSTRFDDAASIVSYPSTTEANKDPKPKPKDKHKGSIWDRFLGKSSGSIPQDNSVKSVTDEAILEDLEEPRNMEKPSKRKSTRDGSDYHDTKKRSSIEATTPQISSRISQDLPAKDQRSSLPPNTSDAGSVAQYLDHCMEPEQVEKEQPESFLVMRPEPPPPPDTRAESDGLSDPLETTSLPNSPRSESEAQSQRFSDGKISSPTQITAALPSSPTAIPFHSRRPSQSSSTARSLSQTPLSSNHSPADLPPKQKTRPRSTEFKSSKEIRPLWPVGTHRSHQEPTDDEIYPSLPSSHTTSRSSSVHDLEESEHHQREKCEINEAKHELIEVKPAPKTSTDSHPIQPDLLDSQQATPTASSFQESRTVQDLPSSQASRDSSPKVSGKENPHQSSSTLKSGVLDAALGGSAAVALNEAIQNNDLSRQDLFREEKEDFEHGLDDMVLDAATYPSYNDTLDQQEDFVPQKTKKGKKYKRKTGRLIETSLAGVVETKQSTKSTNPEPLSPEAMRQNQGRDAQDVVDLSIPSVVPSNKDKKSKKSRDRALVERLLGECGPFPNLHEPPRDNLETAVPAEGQESDTLTREMSCEQIVDVMTAAALDANKDENQASQFATAVSQDPFEIQEEENRTESKGKKGENARKSLPHDNLPQDDVQTETFSQDELPEGLHRVEIPQDNLTQSSLQKETLFTYGLPHDQLPRLETQLETRPQGDFSQANLPRDDFSQSQDPQDGSLPVLSSSSPAKVAFIDPFLEQVHRNVLESSNANPACQEELDRGDVTIAISPPLELSPRAIPLPNGDDDHDLLDERLETPVLTSVDHSDHKEMEIAAKYPSDVPHIRDPSAVIPEPQQQSQDLPSQAERVDANIYFAASLKRKSKMGKKGKQSVSVEGNETSEIQEENGSLPNVVTSTTLENDFPGALKDESAMEDSQEKSGTMEDEWGGFTSKKKGKKGKKAKQNLSVENSKAIEIQEGQESLPEMAASEAPEDPSAIKKSDESTVDVFQPKTEPIEVEWMGFNSKKKGKKGKKVKPSFSVENNDTTEIGEESELLSRTATTEAPEYYEATDMTDESAMHARKSELLEEEPTDLIDVLANHARTPEVVEDKWVVSVSKKKDESVEKQRSKTLSLGPGPDRTEHQFQRQPVAGDDMNDHISSFATTRTSQDVSAMLRLGEIKASIGSEVLPIEPQAEQILQMPSNDQIPSSGEQNLPVSYKPETAQYEDVPRKAHDDEMTPTLDTSVTGTNAAQVVQDILARESNAESADAKMEAMVASTGMEETATDRPIKEDELDWDTLKKKKGKMGKKNELVSWDEPETIEPAEVLGPPGATDTPLEQEPAADTPIEEDELDRDALKKKRKGKKGKKKEVFSLDEPEIMKPAELSGPPAATNPLPLEQEPAVKVIDEVFSKQSKKDKENKKGKRKGVSRAASDFRDEDEPMVVPTEVPQDGNKAKDLPAIASDLQGQTEHSVIFTEVPQDENKVENLLPIIRDSRNEVEPSVVSTVFLQDDDQVGHPYAVDRSSSPRGKRDKQNSKKSKVFSLDDDETPTLGDGQTAEIKDPEKDGPEQTVLPRNVGIIEESKKTAQKTQLDLDQDFMPPQNKKGKKKLKKFNAFPLNSDISPAFEGKPVSKTKDSENEAPKQTLPSGVDVVKEPGTTIEGLPEEKKDQEDIKEAQPFKWEKRDVTTQSEQDTTQRLTKSSEIDSIINPLNAPGDLVMVEGKREEPMHGYFDPVSAHAAALGIPHEASSSITSSLEQPTGEPRETTAHHSNGLKGSIVSAVEPERNSLYSLEPSKKDKKRAKKARHLIWEGDELSQEPRAFLIESSVTEDPGEPSIIPVSRDSESWSKPEISAQGIKPTEILQPGMRSEEDQAYQGSVLEERPSQARDHARTMVEAEQEERPSQARDHTRTTVEAEQEESFANAEKGKKGEETKSEKLSVTEPEEDRAPTEEKIAWVTATSPVHGSEQTSEHQPGDDLNTTGEMGSNQKESAGGSKREQAPILTESGAIDEAKEEDLIRDVAVQRAEGPKKQYGEVQWDEPKIKDPSSSAVSERARDIIEIVRNTDPVTKVKPLGSLDNGKPISAVDVEMLNAQEQREYNDEYAKELERAVVDLEPLRGPDINKPIPAVEVEMLDAQEQRDYNEEYAKELERQLSPLQDGYRADPSHNQADTPMFSQSSSIPVMERPYEEEYRPLARPPALEDITEESRSRSRSVQGSPVHREDDSSPFKSSKESKKGKKGKKQQPVIWEDEAATPPLEPESDQGAKPFIGSSQGPALWDIDATRPLDLEEPVDQISLEDTRIASPTGYSNTANNEPLLEDDRSGDYFASQPSRPAEEDVGREDIYEFRRALSTEPPYSSRDRSPARESQTDQDGQPRDDAIKASNQNEELRSLAMVFHDQSRTEADPAKEQVEDDFKAAPGQNTEKGKMTEQKALAREPSSQALGQEDLMDQPPDLETPTTDIFDEISPSRQHSLQRTSHEDELFSVAEGKPTSRGRSGSRGGTAAAVELGGLAAERIPRRDSKKEERRGKKAKEAGKWTDSTAEIGEAESPLDRGETADEEQEHRQMPESEGATRAWQHHQATSPPPPPYAKYDDVADHSVVGDFGQFPETRRCRDSAIYVSSPPMISEEIPYHRAVRDSGYPDTEASPIIDDELENLDHPTELEKGVATGESVEHVQHRHSQAHEMDERQRSTSRSPLEISVEANSDHDTSVSRPKERRKRSRQRSGAAYDSDDSADSGFDIQRRRRREAMEAEPRGPSPVSSTTKDRSSALYDSSLSAREETVAKPQDQDVSSRYDPVGGEPTWSFNREDSQQQRSREAPREGRSGNIPERAPESTGYSVSTGNYEDTKPSLFGGPRSYEDDLLAPSRSPRSSESRGRRRLNTISEDSADGSPLHRKDKRAMSDVGSPESGIKGRRMRSPPFENDVAGADVLTHTPISIADEAKRAVDERSRSRNSDQLSSLSSRHSALAGVTPRHRDREDEYGTRSAASVQSEMENGGLIYRSGTPLLRRVDRSASGDLRGASQKSEADSRAKSSSELEAELDIGIPSSSTYDPVTDKGKSRADMADVYEGWGDVRGQSPMSPTRPPSMRKRQSMQLLDLENRFEQIVSENRLLASQTLTAEKALQEQARDHSQERHAYEEAMQEHKIYLIRKDSELSELKQIIEQLHDQAAHFTESNEGHASARGVNEEHEQRYSQLRAEHAHTHEQWQQSTKELEDLKEQHTQLSTGMEDIVRHEVNVALDEKNLELRQLQSELETAKQQVRKLQQQLLASRNSDDFLERDEDYFDSQCQSLCQHVQQWVLRFSKFSDMKACYLAREIQDEKVVDRMENAVLDGSDVDDYLCDRVKRRDVFMSVVMTMIWEFIFTRYLFGMDREQRQKLKNLEKTLQEVGPISAVHKWRATTLTLLMKREAFENQRTTDTQAVVHEIYDTLATFLPPPSHLVAQIQDSLRKVIDSAVDLSIEMRTQRAEYSMLPPLQPEYDTNGDLARKVYFSALTMNERSGATSSNEALQEQHAVVRMVLFPLVVKNEDDDEQIVVCPAQVLTAEGSKGKKTARVQSALGGRSEASFAGSDIRMEGGMI